MQKKIVDRFGLLLFVILIAYTYTKFKKDECLLKNKGVLFKAKITGDKLTKSGLSIQYTFPFKKANFEQLAVEKNIDIGDVDKFFKDKIFPLILLEENPKNNKLLIFKEDFERYGLAYPDSLKWVCDSLKLKDCR